MDKTILIVDDDRKIAELIDFRLKKQGYLTHIAYRGKDAVEQVRRDRPVLVMLDIRLPDLNGVEVLKLIQKIQPSAYVIMISAHADVRVAVDCMKIGAYDFIEKPFEFPELDNKVKHVFDQFHLQEEVSMLKKELGEKYKYKSIVGKSKEMKKVFQCVEIATKSDVSVLIQGESGTGKEMIARAIHFSGSLKDDPFVPVNCGAIPENLLESELFGHEKGAFTGAVNRKIGKFEQAQGGTIFLDEIGDLSSNLQVKLLRVLQEREIERVGGSETIPIQVRIIAATNKDLKGRVSEGKFREDLFYRINVFPIHLPALRDRKEDIPELLRYFLQKRTGENNQPVRIDSAVLKRLIDYPWPGNIRELENFVDRLMLIKGDATALTEKELDALEIIHSDMTLQTVSPQIDRHKMIGETEKVLLENALRESRGNVSKASKMLSMSRDTFYRKMKKYLVER